MVLAYKYMCSFDGPMPIDFVCLCVFVWQTKLTKHLDTYIHIHCIFYYHIVLILSKLYCLNLHTSIDIKTLLSIHCSCVCAYLCLLSLWFLVRYFSSLSSSSLFLTLICNVESLELFKGRDTPIQRQTTSVD